MAKFRKKPIVVTAEQWVPGSNINGVTEGFVDYYDRPCAVNVGRTVGFIDTLEGRMQVEVGDWIVTGIKGEKYPVKADIFKETYEFTHDFQFVSPEITIKECSNCGVNLKLFEEFKNVEAHYACLVKNND